MQKINFSKLKWMGCSIFILLLSLMFPLYSIYAQSNDVADSPIQLIAPEEGCLNISKKAFLKVAIKMPFDPQKLLVLFDGADISGILDITPEGFEHKATSLLTPGSHTLSVTITPQEGQEIKREFTFSTCQSKVFEEIYSSNEITALYEKNIAKSEDFPTPSWRVESNLASQSKLTKGPWELKFNTNLRYFNQHLPPAPPPDIGFNLANYLFQLNYGGERISFLAEQGDLVIDETANTVSGLARRGGHLVFQSKDLHLQLRTFDVKSEQLFGFNGGLGFGANPAEHIMGVSGDITFFSERTRFRTIYARGGEEVDSFGISSAAGERKGDVWGFVWATDIFKQKLITEAEYDISRFDGDTSDEIPAKRDHAYRGKVSGIVDKYSYEALYEYMGPDYEVIGNPCLQKDRQGFTLKGGANYQFHVLNLAFSRYNDNVKKDDLYPRLYTTEGTLNYTLSKFQSLPIMLSYTRSTLRSKNEPDDLFSTKTTTDMTTGSISYIKGPWTLGFQVNYSFQNDLTDTDMDTTTVTYVFIPAYTLDDLSISPSFSYNRSRAHATGVFTDTYTPTLDVRGDLFKKKITYGFGATYSILRASDDSFEQDTLSTNFNVSYLLAKNLWGFLNPSIGIRGLYNRTDDRVLHDATDEFAFYLVLQASMPFIL